jgi:cyclic beta-1,2-glucan synthetase
VEPYVVAADVYSVAPHAGRGGWTWYTGAAGWMYRAGVEGLLGIRREGAFLVFDPRLAPDWPGYEASVYVEGTRYDVEVFSRPGQCGGVKEAQLDGVPLQVTAATARVPLDGKQHVLHLVL